MKKGLSLLLVIGVMFLLPIKANAAEITVVKGSDNTLPCEKLSTGNEKCTVKVNVAGDGVKVIKTKLTSENAQIVTETITAPAGSLYDSKFDGDVITSEYFTGNFSGDAVLYTFEVTPNTTGENCRVTLELIGGEGEETPGNPQTGDTLPYIIIGGCLIAGVYVFMMTRNKSKMYKI